MAEAARGAQAATVQSNGADNVVKIRDLHVEFRTTLGVSRALNGVSYTIPRGKVLGVVGESGCGKSVTGLSILQLVPHPGRIVSGEVIFREHGASKPVDLLKYGRQSPEMRAIRGRSISMIFQEPMTSLNPCYTVGDQIMEAIRLHKTRTRGRPGPAPSTSCGASACPTRTG